MTTNPLSPGPATPPPLSPVHATPPLPSARPLAPLLLVAAVAAAAAAPATATILLARADHTATAAPPRAPGSFTVQGLATLDVSPDCADLTMTIFGDGASPGAAVGAMRAKQRDLLAALDKIGVGTADLKLSYLQLNPAYAQEKGFQEPKLIGYHAEITVTATTKKFDQVPAIMEAGANAGAASMSSQFRRSDLPELKKKVRTMALAAAKDKAAQTVATLGIGLGRITSVAEAPAGSMWGSAYFPTAATANAQVTLDTSRATPAIGGMLQTLTLEVTIGYELPQD